MHLVRRKPLRQPGQPPPRDRRHRAGQRPADLTLHMQIDQQRAQRRCRLLGRSARLSRTARHDERRHLRGEQALQIKAAPIRRNPAGEERPDRIDVHADGDDAEAPLDQQVAPVALQRDLDQPVGGEHVLPSHDSEPAQIPQQRPQRLPVKWFE